MNCTQNSTGGWWGDGFKWVQGVVGYPGTGRIQRDEVMESRGMGGLGVAGEKNLKYDITI